MLKTHSRIFPLFLMTVAASLFFAGKLAAEEFWVQYKSDSGIFSVRIPEEHETEFSTFFVADNRAINSEEIYSVVDQRPYRNIIKSYIVKADQTIGGGMNDQETALLLEREMDMLEDFYAAYGGKVISRKTDGFGKMAGGELLISYKDTTVGNQIVHAVIFFSKSIRMEQILVGPESTLNSLIAKEFFKSLNFTDGVGITTKLLTEAWDPVKSPLGIFTYFQPPIAKPYFTEKPVVKHTKDTEKISMIFKDPVRNQSLYYNIYGYKLAQPLTQNIAEAMMIKGFILRHKANPKGVRINHGTNKLGKKVIDITYNIPSPKEFPFLQTTTVRATYDKDVMIVQEALSSQVLIFSPFAQNLLNTIEFHPENFAVRAQDEEKSVSTPAIVKDTSLTGRLSDSLGAKPEATGNTLSTNP